MSYVLNKSNGSTLLVLNDGIIDTALTSIALVGKNIVSYGDAQNENFLHLLENFASSNEPRSPIQGQLWFDSNSRVFRPAMFDGVNWRPLAVSIYGSSPVDTLVNGSGYDFAATQPGDFWFDSINNQFYVISNTSSGKTLIGPETVGGFNSTKMTSTKMFDLYNISHPVIQIILDGEIIGILSPNTFIPSLSNNVPGFAKVNRGLTFKNYNSSTHYSTSSSDVVFCGLHEQLDQSYPRRNINEHIRANWYFDDSVVLNFGSTGQSTIGWNSNALTFASSNAIKLQNLTSSISFIGQNITPSSSINLGSHSSPFASIYSSLLSSSSSTSYGSIEGNWNLTSGSSLSPSFDNSNSIGVSGRRFSSVWTRNLSAGQYFDIGTLAGTWKLTTSSSISPLVDLSATLGTPSLRYSSIYATAISATSLGTITFTGTCLFNGDIVPTNQSSYKLGTDVSPWNKLYVNEIFATDLKSTGIESVRFTSSISTITTASITNANITHLSFNTITDNFYNVINKIDLDGTLSANSDFNFSTQRAIKTYVDTKSTVLQNQLNSLLQPDTDVTLSANSNSHIATQRATKTYVDTNVTVLQNQINGFSSSVGFGNGQAYYDELGARQFGTVYTNDTNKLMWVNAVVSSADLDWDEAYIWSSAFVNGIAITLEAALKGGPGWMTHQFFVPPHGSYYINIYCPDEPTNNLSYGQSIVKWTEFK